MSESESDLDARLDAVERALTDDGTDLADVRDAAARSAAVDDLEQRVEQLEETVAELDAAVQAVRGYAGNVRAVNREVERRASAALAKAEALESSVADRSSRDPAPADTVVDAEPASGLNATSGPARTGLDGDRSERGDHDRRDGQSAVGSPGRDAAFEQPGHGGPPAGDGSTGRPSEQASGDEPLDCAGGRQSRGPDGERRRRDHSEDRRARQSRDEPPRRRRDEASRTGERRRTDGRTGDRHPRGRRADRDHSPAADTAAAADTVPGAEGVAVGDTVPAGGGAPPGEGSGRPEEGGRPAEEGGRTRHGRVPDPDAVEDGSGTDGEDDSGTEQFIERVRDAL